MKQYIARLNANGQIRQLGKFNTQHDAFCICVERAKKSGCMCGETEADIIKGLSERGFYNVGYSYYEFEVEEVEV